MQPKGQLMKTNDISAFRKHNKHDLSERLQECLFYLLLGLPTKAIADKMECSFRTCRQHTRFVYDQFDVNSHTELLAKFITPETLQEEQERMMWRASDNEKR